MRIPGKYAYLWGMKERLNLTIDGELLEAMKAYAAKRQMSVSELVENHFRKVTTPIPRKNVIDVVEGLKKPVINAEDDLKELYYKEQKEKYGF